MLEFEDSAPAQRRSLLAAFADFVAGNALQIQQEAFWDVPLDARPLALAAAGYWIAGRAPSAQRHCLAIGAMVTLGFCTTGLRSRYFDRTRLDTAWEGRDVQVTGLGDRSAPAQ